MKLQRIRVENYRRLRNFEIAVREHLVLVGANDVGKSSLLRAVDLALRANAAQLYANVTVDDFRDPGEPLVIEIELTDFGQDERAYFPDEIYVDPQTSATSLTIQLRAEADDKGSLTIQRIAPFGGTGRQISRDQLDGLGWKFLSATASTRDIREDRRSAVDDLLRAIELGDEQRAFVAVAEQFQVQLDGSKRLEALRGRLAEQLSKALPARLDAGDLAFVTGAAATEDVLNDVRLQITKEGERHDLSEQSDGTRALFAIALYDLMTVALMSSALTSRRFTSIPHRSEVWRGCFGRAQVRRYSPPTPPTLWVRSIPIRSSLCVGAEMWCNPKKGSCLTTRRPSFAGGCATGSSHLPQSV